MKKRILALALALLMLAGTLMACSHGENDKGAYVRMYLSEPVYDLDPLTAFDNEAALQVITMLYEPLFYADKNGDPQKALVDDYEYIKDEDNDDYRLLLHLKETCWSDGNAVTAKDVQFAFLRLFDSTVSHPATALLYDIKGARDIVNGDTVGHLRVSIVNNLTVEIEFERDIDVDDFLVTLCSPALIPLRDEVVESDPNWAKSRTTIVCSGPFTVRTMNLEEKDGFTLERNAYYYRDRNKDDLDKYVDPFRLIIDYTEDPIKQLERFESGEAGSTFYFGHIPLAARNDEAFAETLKRLKVTDAPSTHVYYPNHNVAPFDNADVRKALSLAIDREAIVEALVYARAAEGLVPYTILNRPDKNAEFRKKAESYIAATANMAEAERLLDEAGITPSDYSFDITVYSADEDHLATAELVKIAWKTLGFNVDLRKLGPEPIYELEDTDNDPMTEKVPVASGKYNNAFSAALAAGDFDVIALDLVATAPDAFGYLAPFATAFSGNAMNTNFKENPDYELTPHVTGYQSESYEAKIEAAFAAEKNKDTANLLHEAEAILIAEDMAVIPIVHNQNVSLRSKKLRGVDTSFYTNAIFTNAKLSGYWDIALLEGFVKEEEENEDA